MKQLYGDPIKHNFYTSDDILGGEYNRSITVIVPDKDERPDAMSNTIKQIALANHKAREKGIDFRINEIILADQSDDEIVKKNRGALYTVKDTILQDCQDDGIPIPTIYHLVLGNETDEVIGDYASDFYGDVLMSGPEPRGKGWNMMVSSLGSNKTRSKGGSAIVYLDAENAQIRSRDVISLGLPLYREGSKIKFVKSCFTRYHMEGEKRKLGGRVNNSAFKPLSGMLYDAHVMPRVNYPLSGEVGIDREKLWDISMSKRYGVEWGMLLQLLTPGSNIKLDIDDEYAEVYIGLNMDKPLAEGLSPKEVLKRIGGMIDQIMVENNGLIGQDIKKIWADSNEFMKDFKAYQERSMKRWMNYFESGKPEEITGNISYSELSECARQRLQENIEHLYNGDVSEGDHLTPLNVVRDGIGDGRFHEFSTAIANRRVPIL